MRCLLLLAALTSMAGAATIDFLGVPTGVNDGVDYVTPYEISINGVSQLVTCYDIFDDVNWGDRWQANILTIDQASATGYFAGKLAQYERVAWLDGQSYSNADQQVGLQHAIWDVFGSVAKTSETLRYEALADAAAANAYAGFDFSRFRFVEQVNGVVGARGTEQAFVFAVTPSTAPAIRSLTSTSSVNSAPEPGTFWLLSATTATGLFFWNRQRAAARQAAPGRAEPRE